MIQDDLLLIRERIEKARNIAVFAHVRPDGDSIGSVLGLGWALEDIGKKVQYISEDPVPERYHFLFQFTADGKNPFIPFPVDADCTIVPDISSEDRAGKYFLSRPDLKPDICIDHHISNQGTGILNWIEPKSPAACAVLTGILPKLGLTITKRISSALLCGIITDTNSFSTSNVNADSLRSAAALVDYGADIFSVCHQSYKEHTLSETSLWKIGMDNMHIEGDLVWTAIRKKERDSIGYIGDDDCGFVSYMGNTKGMKVSVLFMEVDEKTTKISWRSLPGYNVANVAVAHGGGGHAAASGATISGKIDEIIPLVLNKTKEMLF